MKTWQIIASVVGLAVVVPVGCSIIGGATSVATAPGRVLSKTMETNNIIANYEFFRDSNQNFIARAAQVTQYKAFLAAETDPAEKSRLRTELGAMQQSCRELAAQYNSNASKLNRKVFQGSNVPATLNAAVCE